MSPQAETPCLFNVLFCDDNSQFADEQIRLIRRKLKTRFGLDEPTVGFTAMTNLQELQQLIREPARISCFDLVFCDLGWSDLNLEGIQILHDVQMAHPAVTAVLFTAQDEDSIISQALQWKFDFIDRVIKIDGKNYFEKFIDSVGEVFIQKRFELLCSQAKEPALSLLESFLSLMTAGLPRASELRALLGRRLIAEYAFKDIFPECAQLAQLREQLNPAQIQGRLEQIEGILEDLTTQAEDNIAVSGQRFVEQKQREEFLRRARDKVGEAGRLLQELFEYSSGQPFSLELELTRQNCHLRLKPDLLARQEERTKTLLEARKRFPRLEPKDLLALDKARYIKFIMKKYGGFPQMAKARNLDLNNLYRVNRRFKLAPIVVFQYDTIQEMVGLHDREESENEILGLAADRSLLIQH